MAPVNPVTTSRLKVFYTGQFFSHTMLFHGVIGEAQATLVAAVREVLEQMAPLTLNGTTFDRAEYAETGSHLFFPVNGWEAIVSASGVNKTAGAPPNPYLQWGGRDTAGGFRKKLYLFEVFLPPTNDMKYLPGENTSVDNVTDQLVLNAAQLGNIAGNPVVWASYANYGYNDYLQRKARG